MKPPEESHPDQEGIATGADALRAGTPDRWGVRGRPARDYQI